MRHKPPVQWETGEHESTTWTYYVSRDSLDGVLAAQCTLWSVKPVRLKTETLVLWSVGEHHIGHRLGNFDIARIQAWFRTYPETDLELIKAEVRPTKAELDEYRRKAPK